MVERSPQISSLKIFGPAISVIGAHLIGRWRSFAAALAAGIFLSIAGAFETGAVPLGLRLLLWLPMLLFGTFIGQLVGVRLSRRPRIGESALAVWAVGTLVVTPPIALFAWAYVRQILGASVTKGPLFYLVAVGIITAPLTAIMMLINRPGPATGSSAPQSGHEPAAAKFLDRLPERLRGGVIYAVQSEDHYLRVHTSKGSDLILLRLADAIGELADIEGAQIHRSWWVARAAIAEVQRDDGRVWLKLKDGTPAPVSRPNVKALRESGWI